MKQVEWTEASLEDMATLDKGMPAASSKCRAVRRNWRQQRKTSRGHRPARVSPSGRRLPRAFRTGRRDCSHSPRAEPPRSLPLEFAGNVGDRRGLPSSRRNLYGICRAFPSLIPVFHVIERVRAHPENCRPYRHFLLCSTTRPPWLSFRRFLRPDWNL